jgi:XRE family transcriptional regulator, regulator of sulfur utilization
VNDPDVERQLRSIAANVRRRRAELGLTQEQLGEAAGISYRYLQDIERGRKNITVETLVRMARALRSRPFQLMRASPLLAPQVGRPRKSR